MASRSISGAPNTADSVCATWAEDTVPEPTSSEMKLVRAAWDLRCSSSATGAVIVPAEINARPRPGSAMLDVDGVTESAAGMKQQVGARVKSPYHPSFAVGCIAPAQICPYAADTPAGGAAAQPACAA